MSREWNEGLELKREGLRDLGLPQIGSQDFFPSRLL